MFPFDNKEIEKMEYFSLELFVINVLRYFRHLSPQKHLVWLKETTEKLIILCYYLCFAVSWGSSMDHFR